MEEKTTFSFSDEEFADQPEDEPSDLDEVVSSFEEPENIIEDNELADVDLRLETADYYRAVLRHSLFDAKTPAAQIVDREVRSFIRERLEILLGLRTKHVEPVVQPQFAPEEVEALKMVAGKLIKKPALMETPIKKVSPPPAKPEVKRIPTPVPSPKTAPKAQGTPKAQVVTKPKQTQPVQKPKQTEASQKKTKPTPKPKSAAPEDSQTFISAETGKEVTLVEGEIITEKGRKFKVVRNEIGTLYRKDITGQVVPSFAKPQMTPEQISIASQMMAEQQIKSLDELTGSAVVAALQG